MSHKFTKVFQLVFFLILYDDCGLIIAVLFPYFAAEESGVVTHSGEILLDAKPFSSIKPLNTSQGSIVEHNQTSALNVSHSNSIDLQVKFLALPKTLWLA